MSFFLSRFLKCIPHTPFKPSSPTTWRRGFMLISMPSLRLMYSTCCDAAEKSVEDGVFAVVSKCGLCRRRHHHHHQLCRLCVMRTEFITNWCSVVSEVWVGDSNWRKATGDGYVHIIKDYNFIDSSGRDSRWTGEVSADRWRQWQRPLTPSLYPTQSACIRHTNITSILAEWMIYWMTYP